MDTQMGLSEKHRQTANQVTSSMTFTGCSGEMGNQHISGTSLVLCLSFFLLWLFLSLFCDEECVQGQQGHTPAATRLGLHVEYYYL